MAAYSSNEGLLRQENQPVGDSWIQSKFNITFPDAKADAKRMGPWPKKRET